MTKEIIELNDSDKFLYNLAPFMVIIASFLAFSCLPISKGLEVLDFNVGVFFLLAASSIGVVGILLAGWGFDEQVLTDRCHAKRCTDHQLRTVRGAEYPDDGGTDGYHAVL